MFSGIEFYFNTHFIEATFVYSQIHSLFQYSGKNCIPNKWSPEEQVNTAKKQWEVQLHPPKIQKLDLEQPGTPEVRPSPISILLSLYHFYNIVYIY